ncbi:ABC transporter ATP-binding protein [Aquamicrobium defluvii]|uniref:Iron(III) transport system ATP-binding protein n=1 Tax=Aquamicrobium defluvii TaxID=69279 RepID=A0A011UJ76_9HYPH|nr:ABC transporter ATP-binding protein [Aquamicrobium defluvii]EXL05918.1 sugar ABC transporter [Aquamicrobium defluvii]EZQ14336.1 sugar ABC transporter [Halopseudomonas bauzanensis]TDR33464.1 iron(III) transport system ATP-binding protein [Aquamicrobium defluvii]
MSFLELSGLRKTYGPVAALDGIDLAVASGSRTAIVGPSGCGKTTLLRLIAGFERPDAGSIELDGATLAGAGVFVPAYRRPIGLVAQDGALFPHLSIAANIGFGIARDAPDRQARIAELIRLVGLDQAFLQRRPHQLSGGQQQRVALARALARKPRLMLLDEPFSALDTGLRAAMRKTVAGVLEAAGVTTILVTHDQEEALSFADQVAVMRAGALMQAGAPRDLYLRPRNRMVAEFLGEAIILPARVADGHAHCILGAIPVDRDEQQQTAEILLRPEQIGLEPDETGGASAVVTDSEFSGPTCTLTVEVANDAGEADTLVLRHPSAGAPQVGTRIRLTVSGSAHLLS